MRAFVLLSLVAFACGDKLGYNYHPVPHSEYGLPVAPGAGLGSALGLSSVDFSGHFASAVVEGATNTGVGSGSGFGDAGSLGDSPAALNAPNGQPEYEKEYLTYVAPENESDEDQRTQQITSSLKKKLQVLFIKAPENKGLENVALNLAQQAADQKTHIFVLSKQTNTNELASKINAIGRTKANKPEVHFVKYRTSQEAANAQREIQAYYDSVQGTSQNHPAVVGTVVDVSAPSPSPSPALAPSSVKLQPPTDHSPANFYLPPALLRRVVRV